MHSLLQKFYAVSHEPRRYFAAKIFLYATFGDAAVVIITELLLELIDPADGPRRVIIRDGLR
jgi:hypothetical protein